MLVVLGNAAADLIYSLSALPRPGETINADHVARDLGGKGLNQAIAARRAGAVLRFIAPVGDDAVAERIRALLAAEGIDDSDLIARSGPSDTSVILRDRQGENAIISDASLAEGLNADAVVSRLHLKAGDALLLQGNHSEAATGAAIAAAKAARATVYLNAAPMRPWLRSFAGQIDVLIANRLEAQAWAGLGGAPLLAEIAAAISAALTVITLGADGCLVRRRGTRDHLIPAPATAATDTTGAGDAFAGVFVAESLATGDYVKAARLAVLAASEKTARKGTASALPTTQDIARLRRALAAAPEVAVDLR